jgi:hypothetical protein
MGMPTIKNNRSQPLFMSRYLWGRPGRSRPRQIHGGVLPSPFEHSMIVLRALSPYRSLPESAALGFGHARTTSPDLRFSASSNRRETRPYHFHVRTEYCPIPDQLHGLVWVLGGDNVDHGFGISGIRRQRDLTRRPCSITTLIASRPLLPSCRGRCARKDSGVEGSAAMLNEIRRA